MFDERAFRMKNVISMSQSMLVFLLFVGVGCESKAAHDQQQAKAMEERAWKERQQAEHEAWWKEVKDREAAYEAHRAATKEQRDERWRFQWNLYLKDRQRVYELYRDAGYTEAEAQEKASQTVKFHPTE